MYQADGTAVQVPLGDVASVYRSGRAGFAEGQDVHIDDPAAGGIVKLKGAEAASFLQSAKSFGTSAVHADDFAAQEERKSFQGVAPTVAAAGLGAARGLTIGLSDAAIAGVGGEDARKYLQKSQKYSPVASALGEGAGMLAPVLATGGTSAGASAAARAGRLATALPRGVMAAGEAGGALGTKAALALGAEEGGRIAGAAKVLAQNAVEGAAYGAGQAVSDASIKGEPLELEKIIAGGGHGALLGAALGGALHGTVALGKGAALKAGGAVKEGVVELGAAAREKLVSKIASAVEGDAAAVGARELERAPHLGTFDAGVEATGGTYASGGGSRGPRTKEDPFAHEPFGGGGASTSESVPGAMPGPETYKQKIRDFLGAASKGDIKAMEGAGNEFILRRAAEEMGIGIEGKGARQLASEIADEASRRSLNGTSAKALKNYDKLTKDARALVPELIEEDLRAVVGLDKHAIMSRSEMEAAGVHLKREAGKEMESVLIGFDKAAAGDASKLPNLSTSTQRIEKEIITPMLDEVRVLKADGSTAWADNGRRLKIAEELRGITSAHEGSLSFKDMHSARKYFDEGVNFSATSAADVMKSKAMRSARGIMEEELTAAADRAVGSAGGESALKWQAAKNRWAASNAIAENAKLGAFADAKNRVTGLSEQLGASRGAAIGTAAGAALGSIVPVFGTAAGGLLGGLGGSMLGKHAASIERRFGPQYVAKIAREAGTDGVLRGTMAEVDKALDSKLGTYLGEKGIEAAAAAKNKLPSAKSAVEDLLGPSRVEGAAQKAGAEEVKAAQAEVEKLRAQADGAPPGDVRRALLKKVVEAKDRVKAAVDSAKQAATELGEKAGRVAKALPSAPAIATEADRVQKRAVASREDEYAKKRQQYADLAASPAKLKEATASVRVARPDLADGLERKLAGIVAYLEKKAPLTPTSFTTLTPSATKPRISPAEQARWLATVKAAENPLSVLDDLNDGRLTSAGMATVKELYPELHAEIAQRVLDKLSDRKEPLSYRQRLQVGLLLGVPTDASLEPSFIASTQATFEPLPPPGQPAPAPAPLRKQNFSLAQQATTKMGALESGGDL